MRSDPGYRPEDDVRERLPVLIRAIAENRDKRAFAQVFTFFAPRLRAYLRRLSVGDEALDDMIQEVMVNVWRRAHQYDAAKANVSTWVFTIARNKRIDILRRERRPEIDPHDPALVGPADRPPDAAASLFQEAGLVRGALAALPSEQAEVLKLSFFEDKSHSEIAVELGLPLGTVKSRVRLAIKRLRSLLESHQ